MKKIQNVLLIDDSKAENNRNKSLLESMALFETVTTYSNPNDALAFFKTNFDSSNLNTLPEIILLDVEMPEMDAFEFLYKYRKIDTIIRSKFKPLIIIVSNHLLKNDNMEKSKYYFPIGVNDQILKPIDKEDILSIVEDYLEK